MTLSQSIIFCAILFYGTAATLALTIHSIKNAREKRQGEKAKWDRLLKKNEENVKRLQRTVGNTGLTAKEFNKRFNLSNKG